MIEHRATQPPAPTHPDGALCESQTSIKLANFNKELNTYEPKQNTYKNGVFTLQSRPQRQCSRTAKGRLQKRVTVSYIQGNYRLSTEQQRPSFESSTTRSIVYAKNTDRDTESHKELKPSVKRDEQKTIGTTTKGNNAHYENHQSGAFRGNVSRCQVNLKIDLVKVVKTIGNKQFMLCFCVVRACRNSDIMSISEIESSHTQTTKA
tara:strand:- start:578 stop:1195 length:618 start_codon:yes stop_codon:yes gene_type:complete